jgi:hypothetical protein
VAPSTDTPQPSPTPEPALAILLAPPGSDASLVESLQPVIVELAEGDGLVAQTRSELMDADWEADVRLVVALPPDPGLGALAASHPGTHFLALGVPGLEPAGNLSVLAVGGARPDRQGFLAGYLAAVITPDWRVGVISRTDTSAGVAVQGGFVNGAIFYCGLCRPAYPPFYQYPVVAGVVSGASQAEQQAAADVLIGNAVQTVFVAPGAGDEGLLNYLAEAGVNIIGSAPPPDQVRSRWVASIQADWAAALRAAWPQLIRGQGNMELESALQLTDRNENLFSPGRQLYVERMLEDLLAGYIDTGIDPSTGDPR